MVAARHKGQVVGYRRVSSVGQNEERQLEGVPVDKMFTDKASGKDTKRPQLERALEFMRDGDVFVVHSMDRLSRNLHDLSTLVKGLTGKGVTVVFHTEHLTFDGGDDKMSQLMLGILGSVAQFERAMIRERQLEGIALAKKKGKYKGGKPKLSKEKVKELLEEYMVPGVNRSALAKKYGISRQTMYTIVATKLNV